MKNIRLFESKDAYDAAKSGLILPRVSYIKENQDVKYNPTFDANGHDYVEIAGIKWATMNVGANDVTDYGLHFQWGDTKGYTAEQVGTGEDKKKFASDWSDYSLTTDGGKSFTKYNEKGMTLDLDDDAVHAAWGGSWRMPTLDEFAKLRDAVTTKFVTDYKNSGVNGRLCTAKDGSKKTLFFPACGYAYGGSMDDVGSDGLYWSSSLFSSDVNNAYDLFFSAGSVNWQDRSRRYYGCAVRGVLAEN